MVSIAQNLQAVDDSIGEAATAAGRTREDVRLLAVSKTFGPEAVRAAHAAGQIAFGENYLQESIDKMAALADLPLEWHFIGPIQSNKTRPIAAHFDWVHTVDRLKIAQRLSEQRDPARGPLNICLQVNISGEASKSGATPQELPALARAVAALPHLKLRGLMAIPEPETDPEQQRAPFRAVRQLYEQLNAAGLGLDTLSMGMSGDMGAAIAEGATIVRIGSAIFGQRNKGTA
jgi:pyridoxal phosphate enzyme (YggS family)